MSRIPRLAALLAVGALMTAAAPAAAPASTDAPAATTSGSCGVGDGRGFGTTYVRWIRKTGVGCTKAKRVIRAFHACRQGPKGKCGHRVKRFKCSENRSFGRGSFDSTVTCKRGDTRVNHGYTQWT